MQIRDIMTNPVISVKTDTPIFDVSKLMKEHNIGSIPVCDNSGAVVGIVTDRDIVTRNIANGTDPKTIIASDVMTTDVVSATPSMDIREVSRIMATQQVRRLPVVENNRLVGMVALGDMAATHSFDIEASRALSDISEYPKNNKY